MNPQTPDHDDPIHQAMEASLKGMKLKDTAPERFARREPAQRGPLVRPGKIVSVTDKDVFVEMAPTVQGVCALAEFGNPPVVGESHEFVLRSAKDGLWLLSRSQSQTAVEAGQDIDVGAQIQAKVVGVNTGGLELKVGNRHGFMPLSHIALERVEDPNPYIGQTILCEVIEVEKSKKRLLLSRRVILAREREAHRSQLVATLGPGMVMKGVVKRLESFGAFVDIGNGTEGLLHVSNISRSRVNHPSEALKVGQAVEVVVLDVKEGGKRIGLGMKQLEPNPWDDLESRIRVDSVVKGKVMRLAPFGAFVEIEPGLEGLVHISQLSNARVRRAGDSLKVGDVYEFRVVKIEAEEQRLGLSRLDSKGHVIGGEAGQEEAEEKEVREYVKPEVQKERRGTNLGDLLRKVVKDR